MFVYSIRSTSLKFICTIVLSIAVLISLVALIPPYSAVDANDRSVASIVYTNIEENQDRISFIRQFGWEVSETPVEEVEVVIPSEFDKVYLGYNEMQREQGLNLAKYKGKTVKRYTYTIQNYPNYDGTVYISLLIHKNKVIGGDVCSANVDGFVHGFAAPDPT